MAYQRADLSGPLLLGDDKSLYYYDANDTANDTFASVAASDYFNNADDDLRLAVGDTIEVKATDGMGKIEVTGSTGGDVSCEVRDGGSIVESVSTSQGLSSYGISVLGAAGIYAMDTAPLAAGQHKYILNDIGAVTITTTGGAAVRTTGGNLILRAAAVCAHLIAASTSRWLIMATPVVDSTGLGTDISTS